MTATNLSFKNKLVDHLTKNWKAYVFYLVVLFSTVLFIYALGFSTAWARTEVLGKTYKETQPIFDLTKQINDAIASLAAIGLISAVLNIMVGTHSRKKYFWTNYVLLAILIVSTLATGIYIFVGSEILKSEFTNSFDVFESRWAYLIQLSFQGRDIRPGIIESLSNSLPYMLVGLIASGLSVWLLIDERLKRPMQLAREAEVQSILEKVEKGEIKVSEKVMNQVPSVDDEIIDFTEKEVLEYETLEFGAFHKKHQTSIMIAHVWAVIVTSLIFISFIGSIVIDFLNRYQIIDFNTESIVSLHPSLISFLSILLLLAGFFNLSAIKAIEKIKTDSIPRNTLLGYAIYLIPTTLISGILLLPVALKLPRSKVELAKMRYQNNQFGFTMTFGSMLFFIWSLFTSINYSLFTGLAEEVRVKPDHNIALDITISIVLILVMFLSAEKVKAYSKQWSYGLFVISVVNLLRLFYVPLISLNTNQIPMDIFIQIAICHIISAALTTIAGIVSLKKATKIQQALKQGGK